jgi:hypothetical protein
MFGVFLKHFLYQSLKFNLQNHCLTPMANRCANTQKYSLKYRRPQINNLYPNSWRAVCGLRVAGGAEGADRGSGGVARLNDEAAEGAAVGGVHGHCKNTFSLQKN